MKRNKKQIKALAFFVLRYRKRLLLNIMLLCQDGDELSNPEYH